MMYGDLTNHLETLDSITSHALRQAYMGLVMAALSGGLEVRLRVADGERELLFRDAEGRQPFTARLAGGTLDFCLRRPLLDAQAGLALAAVQRFGNRLLSDPASLGEVRVRLETVADVEELMEFLQLRPRLVSLGYGARISA
jgi:hypothetical protein